MQSFEQVSTGGDRSAPDSPTGPGRSPLASQRDGDRTTGSAGRAAYVLSQILVRVLAILVLYTLYGASAVSSGDGVVAERGSATASRCDRVGPLSQSGLGWWWQCDALVTWEDGTTARQTFTFSALTPENLTVPADVELREWERRGGKVLVSTPAPYSSLGAALMIPLLGLALAGARIPGVPPLGREERLERRRRLRLLAWQPLLLPVGWGLVLAGGLTAGSLGGSAILPVVVGSALLAVGVGVAMTRRRRGIGVPATWPETRVVSGVRWGKALVVLGIVGLLAAMLAIPSGWHALVSAVSIPAAAVAFGARLVLVAQRHNQI